LIDKSWEPTAPGEILRDRVERLKVRKTEKSVYGDERCRLIESFGGIPSKEVPLKNKERDEVHADVFLETDTRTWAEAIARFRKTSGLPPQGAKLIADRSNDVLTLVGTREILSMRGTSRCP
jgi:hypothetical protein